MLLVLVARERAATFPGGPSPQVDRSPAHCLRPTSGRTNTPLLPPVQLHNDAGTSYFPVLCTLECGPLGRQHIRDIWYFTKYRGLNGVRTTNRGQTAATGAGPQCRRYKRATRSLLPSPGFILYTEMQSFGTSPRQ